MSEASKQTDGSGRKSYEEFLLHEYDNIAQAHFKVVETIATFFKHYLFIVSLPFPLLAWALRPEEGAGRTAQGSILGDLGIAVPVGVILIGVVGFLVMCYISNLRFEALLYARTVNGIREYFTSRSTMLEEEEARVRVLPRSTHQPRYFERAYFLWVILGFGLVNGTYCGVGVFLLCKSLQMIGAYCWTVALVALVLVTGATLVTYRALAQHRERLPLSGTGSANGPK